MKIVHAPGWYYPDSFGGTELYVAELARRQRARGHAVSVVAPLAGADSGIAPYEHDGVLVHRYAIPAQPTRDEAQGLVRARGAGRFDDIVAGIAPDIVHFHTFTTGLGLDEIRVAKRLGARVIATSHLGSLGYLCQRGSQMVWGRHLCDGILRPVTCAACALDAAGMPRPAAVAFGVAGEVAHRLGAKAIAGRAGTALGMTSLIHRNAERQHAIVSELDRFVLLNGRAMDIVAANRFDTGKLEVNRLGTAHRDIQGKPGPDVSPTRAPLRIGYVGRLVAIKGVGDLVRAVRSIAADISVEICGPAGDASILGELMSLAEGDQRIVFTGAVPHAEVPERLATFDVLCVPSVTFEGGPTVIAESHAAGTPVIGTTIGAIPELVRDGVDGALFPPCDWRALAGIIARIARDPSIVDAWRRNLPRARTMDEVEADYDVLYEKVLAS